MRTRYRLAASLALIGLSAAALTVPKLTGLMVGTAVSPLASTLISPASAAPASPPITIGYSDWPGWTCWAIAQKEGFFKKHNVNVKLVWFPVYTDSLNAFAANQVDANAQCWSDTMGPLAQGQAAKAVLINDNSAGNDAVVAGPEIKSIKQLRGKKA